MRATGDDEGEVARPILAVARITVDTMLTRTVRLSLDEFLSLPDTKPAGEYDCGEVFQKPMPDNAHATLQGYLYVLLAGLLQRTGLGKVKLEWRCVFGPHGHRRAFVPDLVVVLNERLPRGDTRSHRFLPVAPDIAIEILSPNQPARPFARKLRFYLRHGVRIVWVVDPETETIDVYRPGFDTVALHVGDTLDGADVLPGFQAPLADIFAQLQE